MTTQQLTQRIVFSVIFFFVPSLVIADHHADIHTTVYTTGMLMESQRKVTLGKAKRRIQNAHDGIEIDRLDRKLKWNLDPQTKTYTETTYQKSSAGLDEAITGSSSRPVTLKIARIVPSVQGPLGTANISGYACQSYTIRLIADFADTKTGKVIATETILEKLWIADKAPAIENYRGDEKTFEDALFALSGTETASFRWLLREFNRIMLERNGNTKDFKLLQAAYREARAKVPGITVRQLAGWNWRPLDTSAAEALPADEMANFIVSVAAGLGAPPPDDDKSHSAAKTPKWTEELAKDLGRTGPTAMMLEEIKSISSVPSESHTYEVPTEYRKQ